MPDVLTAQLASSFFASAVGALLAGYTGVWFGLARMKRERGFEQRLTWSREMLRALHLVAGWVDAIGEAESEDEVSALVEGLARDPRLVQFNLHVAEARAYASPRALAALNIASGHFDRINVGADPETAADQRAILVAQLEALRSASEAIADDLRGHLGLERATESSWPFDVPKVLAWRKSLPPAG